MTAPPPGPFGTCTLDEVAARLRSGATDPVTLVERVLDAVAASQPVHNAFVTVDPDGARAAARAARDELARGADRGPLHGIPVAVKDIVDTAGLATAMGSRHFAGHVPGSDAEVVTRLRAAGAVIVGKTTTHEFAFGPTGDRAANGPCANPHDPGRMAGGSSAGSAAAVAAGLVPLAVGTDTGGSVRIPAALCGVTGIRPGPGRIPTDGVFPLSWTLDSVGPIARDVAGTATGWRVLAGHTGPLPAPPPLAGLRIGTVAAPPLDRLGDAVRTAYEGVVGRLRGLVADVRPVAVPDADELLVLYRTVQSGEAVAVHRERIVRAPGLFDPELLHRLKTAATVPAHEYARALRRVADLRATAAGRLAGVDVLILPTVPVVAPPLDARDADLGGGWRSPRDALLAHTAPWSVLGLPAVSLPVPGAGPLPVGLQLVGRPGGDEELLALAATVERALLRTDVGGGAAHRA